MKKWIVFFLLPMMLLGCSAEPVFEQVQDVYSGVESTPAEVRVSLPESATVLVSASDSREQLYFCDDYSVMVQILDGGDLDRSLREITGYEKEELTLLETGRDGMRCISCAWSSLGEQGDQIGRLVLLDDGDYHYAVSVMADAEIAGELTPVWESLLNSVTVIRTAP